MQLSKDRKSFTLIAMNYKLAITIKVETEPQIIAFVNFILLVEVGV